MFVCLCVRRKRDRVFGVYPSRLFLVLPLRPRGRCKHAAIGSLRNAPAALRVCLYFCVFGRVHDKEKSAVDQGPSAQKKKEKGRFLFPFFSLIASSGYKEGGGGAKKGGRDAPRAAQTRRGTAKKRTETCWPSFFVSLSLFACCASRLDSLWLKGFAIRSGCVMRAHIERAVSVLRRRQQRQEDRCAWRHPRSPAD